MIVSPETLVGLVSGGKFSHLPARWWAESPGRTGLRGPAGTPVVVRSVAAGEYMLIKCSLDYGGVREVGLGGDMLLRRVDGKTVMVQDLKGGMLLRGRRGDFPVASTVLRSGPAVEIIGTLDSISYLEVVCGEEELGIPALEGAGRQAGSPAAGAPVFGVDRATRKRPANRRAVRGDGGSGSQPSISEGLAERHQRGDY